MNSDSDNPQVEIFKSFRVAINDPCEVVLPVVSFSQIFFFLQKEKLQEVSLNRILCITTFQCIH